MGGASSKIHAVNGERFESFFLKDLGAPRWLSLLEGRDSSFENEAWLDGFVCLFFFSQE